MRDIKDLVISASFACCLCKSVLALLIGCAFGAKIASASVGPTESSKSVAMLDCASSTLIPALLVFFVSKLSRLVKEVENDSDNRAEEEIGILSVSSCFFKPKHTYYRVELGEKKGFVNGVHTEYFLLQFEYFDCRLHSNSFSGCTKLDNFSLVLCDGDFMILLHFFNFQLKLGDGLLIASHHCD